jgi:hypothetical protein
MRPDPDLAVRGMTLPTLLVLALISATFLPSSADAQPGRGCAGCIANHACDRKRDSCVAECRARLFAIDPKRAECISQCSKTATLCGQTASRSCRADRVCE